MSLYLGAAKRVENEDNYFCCTAIAGAIGVVLGDEAAKASVKAFTRIFRPTGVGNNQEDVWWEPDDKGSRVIALLLMHWIAEDQKKKAAHKRSKRVHHHR